MNYLTKIHNKIYYIKSRVKKAEKKYINNDITYKEFKEILKAYNKWIITIKRETRLTPNIWIELLKIESKINKYCDVLNEEIEDYLTYFRNIDNDINNFLKKFK